MHEWQSSADSILWCKWTMANNFILIFPVLSHHHGNGFDHHINRDAYFKWFLRSDASHLVCHFWTWELHKFHYVSLRCCFLLWLAESAVHTTRFRTCPILSTYVAYSCAAATKRNMVWYGSCKKTPPQHVASPQNSWCFAVGWHVAMACGCHMAMACCVVCGQCPWWHYCPCIWWTLCIVSMGRIYLQAWLTTWETVFSMFYVLPKPVPMWVWGIHVQHKKLKWEAS